MDEETKKRLQAAVAMKHQKDVEAERILRAEREEASAKQDRVKATKERWPSAKKQVGAAIVAVNEELKSTGYSFALRDAKAQQPPAYIQVSIDCLSKDASGYAIVLNIGLEGRVRVVFIPSTKIPSDNHFDLADANEDTFAALLSKYFEQLIASA